MRTLSLSSRTCPIRFRSRCSAPRNTADVSVGASAALTKYRSSPVPSSSRYVISASGAPSGPSFAPRWRRSSSRSRSSHGRKRVSSRSSRRSRRSGARSPPDHCAQPIPTRCLVSGPIPRAIRLRSTPSASARARARRFRVGDAGANSLDRVFRRGPRSTPRDTVSPRAHF